MDKILLIFPAPKNKKLYANVIPPLGMLGIASYLESKGFICDVIDCHTMPLTPDYNNYSNVCFSVNVANLKNTKKIIKDIREKNPRVKIIVGGPFVVNRGKKLLSYLDADVVIVGDAEITVLDYLQAKKLSDVKGIIYRNQNKIIFTGHRKPHMKLDQFPFPALDKIPIEKYNMSMKKKSPISSIVTSRGCPSKCIFCYHDSLWRARSAKHVVDEIEWQVNELGVKEIVIMDDNFSLNKRRVIDVCNLILNRNIKVILQFKNGLRADKVDYDMLKKMKQAGTWLIGFAPEVGSAESLKKIKKGFQHEDVERAVEYSKQLGITTICNFTVGYPWEKAKDVEETINYAIKLDSDLVQFSWVYPIEGTPLYDILGIKPSCELEDATWFFGETKYNHQHMSSRELGRLVKKAYRKFYLRPKKMFKIANTLLLKDVYHLAKYAFLTRSM